MFTSSHRFFYTCTCTTPVTLPCFPLLFLPRLTRRKFTSVITSSNSAVPRKDTTSRFFSSSRQTPALVAAWDTPCHAQKNKNVICLLSLPGFVRCVAGTRQGRKASKRRRLKARRLQSSTKHRQRGTNTSTSPSATRTLANATPWHDTTPLNPHPAHLRVRVVVVDEAQKLE